MVFVRLPLAGLAVVPLRIDVDLVRLRIVVGLVFAHLVGLVVVVPIPSLVDPLHCLVVVRCRVVLVIVMAYLLFYLFRFLDSDLMLCSRSAVDCLVRLLVLESSHLFFASLGPFVVPFGPPFRLLTFLCALLLLLGPGL